MEHNGRAIILVVDDDTGTLKLLEAQLAGDGYVVRTANSGEDALASVEKQLPDLILLDVMMPGIDGFEVARRLKADSRSRPVPVILVTVLNNLASRLTGLEAGADEFLSKPVDRSELLVRVRNLLKIKEYNDFIANHNRILEEQVAARTAELKKNEERLQNILASTPAVHYACCVSGDKCIPVFVSANIKGVFGYDIAECLGNAEWWWSGVHPAERDSIVEAFQACLASGNRHYAHEYRFLHKDGNQRWIHDEFQLIRDKSGKPQEIVGSWIDITERKQADAALAIVNKELAFQNKEKEKRATELAVANKKLQDMLDGTVQAISMMLEMRDPYTAGHQVRVADLAVAIALQMGLPDEQIRSIHLAGMVHDLGKIQTPSEILSKPGKITEAEFALIGLHPQAGYDILRGINFPWPIALMVLQHHERLDGTGYPQGLKGDAILMEARILSVADVVEAMFSHRPYRPGKGIETALAEITRQRGICLDAQVVDACLSLFREQHYSFKQ